MTRSFRRFVPTVLVAVALSAAVLFAGPRLVCAADVVKPYNEPGGDKKQKVDAALPEKAPAKPAKARKVLVYGNAEGFVHGSIPTGQYAVAKMGEKTGAYTAVVSNDPAMFDADNLKQFDAVVLVSTTGHFMVPKGKAEDVKAYKEKDAERIKNLIDFVKSGKGVAGFHAASDAYYDVRAWGETIGGYFSGHKAGNEKIAVTNEDAKSPVTAVFEGKNFDYADEIYRFGPKGKDGQTFSRSRVRVQLSADPAKNNNEKPGTDMPVAWVQKVGEGRVFYSSLGHNDYVFWDAKILQYYLAGIQFATGDLEAPTEPQGGAPSARVHEPGTELLAPIAGK